MSASGLVISHFVNDISLLAFTYGAMGGKLNWNADWASEHVHVDYP